jgi:hypothetical protein
MFLLLFCRKGLIPGCAPLRQPLSNAGFVSLV